MGVISRDVYDQLSKQVQMGGSAAQAALKQLSGNTIAPPAASSAMSAGQAGSHASPGANVPTPPMPSDAQRSAQAWINNSTSGQGGYDNYVKTQNDRFTQALQSGDVGMIDKLNADADRVGYKFNSPLSATQATAQAWINNSGSGQGGVPAYTGVQQQRYNDAYNSKDSDLMGRLSADAQRVGYELKPPSPQNVVTVGGGGGGGSYPASPYGQLTPDQIKSEAQARIDKMVTDRTRIANQTKQGYQTSFDRMNQRTQENRTLENTQNARNLSPFSGHSDYAQGMIARERGIQDQQNQQDLQTRLGGVDSQLADFLNQTPEQQQQIINDLTRQERDYGLQVGTLTGNLQGYGPTLAKQAQDAQYTGMYNGQMSLPAQLQIAGLTGQFGGQSTLAGKEANWNAYKDAVGMTGNLGNGPVQDWGQLPGQQGPAAFNVQQAQIANLWKAADATGTIPDQLADMIGVPRGTKTTDSMLKNAQAQYYSDHGNYYNNNQPASVQRNQQQQLQYDTESQVMQHAQEFKSAKDVEDYFSSNAPYLTQKLGSKEMNSLKTMLQKQFSSSSNEGKIDAVTSKALSMAMNDPNWLISDDKQALIDQYKGIVQGSLGN